MSNVDMRDAFFSELLLAAEVDEKIVLITVDQDAFGVQSFKDRYPRRFFNVGPSEQGAVLMAAGLALGGMRPVVYGITAFLLGRAYEMIRVDLGLMNLPVLLVGCGGGYTYGDDGPTHHAPAELFLMRTIPEVTSWTPFDAVSTMVIARHVLTRWDGPCYFRLERGVVDDLCKESELWHLGGNYEFKVRRGDGYPLRSYGRMVHVIMKQRSDPVTAVFRWDNNTEYSDVIYEGQDQTVFANENRDNLHLRLLSLD